MIKKFLKLFGIFLVFILLAKFIYSQGWYQINITNSQSTATPAPFQQDIAICNGSINIGNNFAYVNNATLFNEINSNGSNVYFTTTCNSTPNIYSWYEGQENFNGTYCDVWWLNLSNGIPANSNVTIYMYIGNSSDNYYSQYYPYVGEAPQLSTIYGQYDNGNYVFLFYDNFAGTTLNTSKWIANGASYTINNGLTYTTSDNYNVLTSAVSFTDPYIIEYYGKGIANSNNQYDGGIYFNIQGTGSNSNANLWAQRNSRDTNGQDMFYTYISGAYTQYGAWPYSIDGNMHIYTLIVGPNNNPLITERDYILEENYSSFPSTYTSGYFGPRAFTGTTFWQWVRVRAYPLNGVMPSFSIILALTPSISVNTSTNFQFNVSFIDGISEYVNYTVYLNGSVLTTNNVSVTAGQTLTIPYTYQYLFNQSGTYNLTVVAYGQSSEITSIATNIFAIQLDQLNVSMSPTPYTYNNTNYTNLYNSNLNINYYCMRPNNTLIIYDNITNQTLQFNLSCNYIETPENLFVNLTPYIQNNTLNYINGSLTYGTQSFNLSFEPLWDTVVVNLTIYLPQILVYTAPLGMNYTVIENDILPNVVCNTSFYDNNTLIANNQSILTNGSITYSWIISQSPIHNFNWSITCIDPVNVTTSFTYSTGPYYYNEFNLYMEDSGNIPSNVTYSLTLECNDGSIQYSNANDENYTLYLWTNDQCNFVSISQNIQGITFDEGFSTNLLSNYGFQWPICLINISLTYYDNPLIGLQPYRDTLISVENPQTGCYLTGSYLYLSASNYYYEPVPMRPGALYAIRSNNTYLATIEGSTSQAISIDTLIAQTSYLNNQTILVVGYPTVNYTTYNGIPELIISAPANISSAVVSVYYNNQFYTNYTFNSVGSSTLNVILTNLPANYTFNDTNYAIITLTYISGYQQIITYPVNFFSKIALPSFLVYLISVIILYAWTRAFSYYQRLIIAGFGIVLIILLLSVFTINSMAPIVLDAGIFFFFIFDVISRTYLSELTQDHPLFKPISFAFKLFMVLSFVGTFIAFLFGPYGIYYIPISGISDYMSKMASLTQSMGSTISQMTNNMFFVPLGIITLAADLIYAIWLGIRVMAVFISAIITPFSVIFGPFAGTVANIIQALVTYGALVVIVVYLLLLVFALVDKLPF